MRMAFATLVLVIYQGLFIDVIARLLYATRYGNNEVHRYRNTEHSLYSLYLRASRYAISCTLHYHFTPFRAPELQETLSARRTVRAATAVLTRPIAIYSHPRRKHSPTCQFLKQVRFSLVHSIICHPTPTCALELHKNTAYLRCPSGDCNLCASDCNLPHFRRKQSPKCQSHKQVHTHVGQYEGPGPRAPERKKLRSLFSRFPSTRFHSLHFTA
jgi:hypothetical protein